MNKTLRNPTVYILFLLPTLILYFLFSIYPMLSSFYYGFTDWNGLDDPSFIGFDNFTKALSDDAFWKGFLNNVYFLVFSVFIQVPIIIFFALLISGVKRFQRFYKTTVFMPSIISTSVVGILWGFFYEPEMGLVNRFLGLFGIDTIYWLGEEKWAMVAILITNAWQWMGFYIVLVLAAILGIPKELNEAAAIDGASGIQRALRITVPLIRPIISVIVLLSIAGALRVVDIVLVMTKGGPAGATEVMGTYMIDRAIKTGAYGFGTSIAILIFVFALIITVLYQLAFVRNQERVEY